MSGEKTEKPTPKRKKEAKKEGQVPRTQELGAWGAMLLVALALPTLLRHELGTMQDLLTRSLTSAERADTHVATGILREGALHAFLTLVLLGSAIMIVGVGGALAQGGFHLATKAVKPKANKLNPINGAKRIFGPQALWEGGKMLLKTAVLAWFVYHALRSMMPLLGGLMPMSVVLDRVGSVTGRLMFGIAGAGLVMAGVDYGMQRRRVGKQIRMTREEIRQEHKQAEGDPLVKSAIRSRQLAAARSRMMADVPTADVLLVNPTHVAIALRYEPEKGAPRVVARGAGAIALKVREAATEARVPIVRDVPLARALYRSCKVGQEIPPELFAAVAQVLAFVISRRNLGYHGGEHRTPRPNDEVPAVARGRNRALPSGPVPDSR